MHSEEGRASIKIPVIYVTVALFWIVFSHRILMQLVTERKLFSVLNLFLDIAFVFGTAIMLYNLIYSQLREARNAKEIWKEREEQLRFLINTMPDFVCYKDEEGRWLEANTFALELFQLTGVDYKGKTDAQLAHFTEYYREAFNSCAVSDLEAIRSGQNVRVEERIPRPDGTVLIFDAIKVPTFHEDGSPKGLVVIGRNITERKDAERRLEESEERYKSLFEQNPDVVFSLDLHGVIQSVNGTTEKLIGYSTDELSSMHYSPLVAEGDLEAAAHYFKQTLQGGCPTYEISTRHKDGHMMQLRVTNVPIVVKNHIVGMFGIATDITELKMTEELLRKSDRLSVVGELAAGVAHEIRNPLASLTGFVQLLKEITVDHHYYYDIMLSELDRINLIVSEFMFLAKPQVLNFQFKDLYNILKNVMAIAETQAIMSNIQIVTEFTPDLPPIFCEHNQLKQVFINILKNAMEAMPHGGQILIQIKKGPAHIVVRFKDQGVGIPMERIPKLGEPFYSTKEKGMGLGLMVSYKIIEAHHGNMQFESVVGKGTTVEVMLPIVQNS